MKKFIQMLVMVVVVVFVVGCTSTTTQNGRVVKTVTWDPLKNVTVLFCTETYSPFNEPPIYIIDRSNNQLLIVGGRVDIRNGYGSRGYGPRYRR